MRTAASVSRGGGYNVRPVLAIFAFGALLLMITGCNTTCSTPDCAPVAVPVVADGPPTAGKVQDPDDVKYYRSDEPLRMGIEHFNRGNFGIAERYFRDATEKAPKDPTAWIGLAASYDRIARFDLADRAYVYAIRLVGETTEVLNNQVHSAVSCAVASFMTATPTEWPSESALICKTAAPRRPGAQSRCPRLQGRR